jgi:predicted RNA-binding Zn ribbon-like protein
MIMAASRTQRPSPFFIGGHLALDFLNSTAAPEGERIEWLVNGADLVDWLETAGAVDATVAARFRATGSRGLGLDVVAERARRLREWLRAFVVRHAGKALTPDVLDELRPLNRLLAQDPVYRQVKAYDVRARDGRGSAPALDWRPQRKWTTPQQLLMPIAEAIGDLVCHADFRLLRTCEHPNCTLVFYDRTKSHARRWCSMAVCGNRAKVAAHRRRAKERLTRSAHRQRLGRR